MKEYGCWAIFVDAVFFLGALGALISVLWGDASVDDYVTLYFSISVLIGLIVTRICKAKRDDNSNNKG